MSSAPLLSQQCPVMIYQISIELVFDQSAGSSYLQRATNISMEKQNDIQRFTRFCSQYSKCADSCKADAVFPQGANCMSCFRVCKHAKPSPIPPPYACLSKHDPSVPNASLLPKFRHQARCNVQMRIASPIPPRQRHSSTPLTSFPPTQSRKAEKHTLLTRPQPSPHVIPRLHPDTHQPP